MSKSHLSLAIWSLRVVASTGEWDPPLPPFPGTGLDWRVESIDPSRILGDTTSRFEGSVDHSLSDSLSELGGGVSTV